MDWLATMYVPITVRETCGKQTLAMWVSGVDDAALNGNYRGS